MPSEVEGVTWELSGTLYQWLYPLAVPVYGWYAIARKFTRQPTRRPPDKIIHSGIIAHGYLYEFCNEGVKKTLATAEGDPGSICSVHQFLRREKLGSTSVSLKMFDTWVAEQMKGSFAKEKYCVAENNCNHFAMEASRFLRVGNVEDWSAMVQYTESHPSICKWANWSTASPASSTSPSN